MRAHLIAVLGALGCGRIGIDPVDGTSTGSGDDDGPRSCAVHDSVTSCGPGCTVCPAADDRQTPTCDGVACGRVCFDGAPSCSDGSCARLNWSFDDNDLGGIALMAPIGLPFEVRSHDGNRALAIVVESLTEVSFRVPICVAGSTGLQGRTLSATVFMDGAATGGPQYYLQASLPAPDSGALNAIDLPSAEYIGFSAPINKSPFAGAATSIEFQIGTLGAPFAGTIWFDDIKIR